MMPKTKSAKKPVRSFRLSGETLGQIEELAGVMGRSESNIVEIAVDRMYREEARFHRVLDPNAEYRVTETNDNDVDQ
jgi:predicted transcriptional regulator